jgi:hypothetical protein
LKKTIFRTLAIVSFLVLGIVIFIIQRGLLIVEWAINPNIAQQLASTQQNVSTQKKLTFFFVKDNTLQKDEISLIWKDNDSVENLKNLINNWLSFLQDEKILHKSVAVEDVAISSIGQEAYISFDRSPLHSEWSIRKKWLLVEGLLKTIHNAELDIKFAILLVNQKPMEDEQLDFSQPLPVDGFDHS